MIRTVPNIGSEEIDLYMRTYYSLLRTSEAIKIQALVESHMAIDSSLHVHARDARVDVSALIYCTLRLPSVIRQVERIILGQLEEDFKRAGYSNVETWERVHAPGRRRRSHFDGKNTLAVVIASRSDIDDLIPILTALQIEWNKIYYLLHGNPSLLDMLAEYAGKKPLDAKTLATLADGLSVDEGDLARAKAAWKNEFLDYFKAFASRKLNLSLQLLAGSQINYRKAVSRWWGSLMQISRGLETFLRDSPVYFVSSNTHSIANMVSGYTASIKPDLLSYIERLQNQSLLEEWKTLQAENGSEDEQNFFYYILKKYQAEYSIKPMVEAEKAVGLTRIPSKHGFDVEAQIIRLNQLDPAALDPRIKSGLDVQALKDSNALIINIDYPLGLAAFELLTQVAEGSAQILGIYVMGKAATLNGRIGDVMLVNVVHDEHSKNTYLFDNCFQSSDIAPYLSYGTLLDNQKAIAARGTFLQNRTYMDVFYREGYTVLEMEAGPYLSAVYEMIRPQRHPYDEIVNLYQASFDVGIIHYASDTPYSRGHNLGAGSLGYQGMDSTYAATIAILRRIFLQESERLQERDVMSIDASVPSH